MVWVSIDPGWVSAGVAVWDDETLHAIHIVRRLRACPQIPDAARAVVEIPQVYASRGQKGRQSDVIKVAIGAGWITSRLGVDPEHVRWVTPREWKGNVPKSVHHPRICRALSLSEAAVLARLQGRALSDAVDAVGIGLWALGRM